MKSLCQLAKKKTRARVSTANSSAVCPHIEVEVVVTLAGDSKMEPGRDWERPRFTAREMHASLMQAF